MVVVGSTTSSCTDVKVFIPAVLSRPTHTLYSICVQVAKTAQEWTVNRRYSQFLNLRNELESLFSKHQSRCPGCRSYSQALKTFKFPGKHWRRSDRVIRLRVQSLGKFIQMLTMRTFNDLPKCALCGVKILSVIRPFIMRGAQPIGPSTKREIELSITKHGVATKLPPNAVSTGTSSSCSMYGGGAEYSFHSQATTNSSEESYQNPVLEDSFEAIEEIEETNESRGRKSLIFMEDEEISKDLRKSLNQLKNWDDDDDDDDDNDDNDDGNNDDRHGVKQYP